ncbi:hypothetical protein ACFQ0K_13390 [Nocardioides caeni]|uniref:Uncharacterized protein n=1 Tax=Nocardioides caeni TaxID=574700 RepID=A0A4S8N125_9ACTN|nr:hypothetical protein [Nocardioides caeni]THV08789.1 hypothetical protein E9934_19040 [Nocardioides caeni]
MTQQPDTPEPDVPAPAAPEDPATPQPTQTAPRIPLRERSFRLRSLVAVGLAGLLLGAGAGVGTALVVDGHDRHDGRQGWNERRQPPGRDGGPGQDGGRGGERSGVGPGTGQLPPGTTQQDDSDDAPASEDESGS